MSSPFLGLTHVTPGSNSPHIPINTMHDGLENATQNLKSIAITGNYDLSASDYKSFFVFKLTGTPSAFFFEVPNTKRVFVIWNTTGTIATVRNDGGGGAAIALGNGEIGLLYNDGTNISSFGGSGGTASFAGLSDTFSDYDQRTLQQLRVTAAENGLETFISNFDGAGALVKIDSPKNVSAASGALIPWDSAVFDTQNLWDASTKLIVPPGVSFVELWGGVASGDFVVDANLAITILKNNSEAFPGHGEWSGNIGHAGAGTMCWTGIIPVTPGDEFELKIFCSDDSTPDLAANSTFFAMRLIDPNFRGALIKFDTNKQVTSANILATQIPYDSAVYQKGATWWSVGAPAIFTIPDGVFAVKVKAGISPHSNSFATDNTVSLLGVAVNGNLVAPGANQQQVRTGYTDRGYCVVSDLIPVVPGDQITVKYFHPDGAANPTLQADETWASIEAQAFPGFDKGSCRVQLDTDTSVNANVAIPWQSSRDTIGSWRTDQPTRVYVPLGAKKIQVCFGFITTATATLDASFTGYINKNGTTFVGLTQIFGQIAFTTLGMVAESPPITVSFGDYFEGYVNHSDTSYTFEAESTFMSIRVLEWDPLQPRIDVEPMFFSGVPGVSARTYFRVFQGPPRRLPAGAPSWRVRALTAATAQTDFDIKKNNSSIGTMRFAASGTIPTFISLSVNVFKDGDFLEIIAPGTPDATLANIALSPAFFF